MITLQNIFGILLFIVVMFFIIMLFCYYCLLPVVKFIYNVLTFFVVTMVSGFNFIIRFLLKPYYKANHYTDKKIEELRIEIYKEFKKSLFNNFKAELRDDFNYTLNQYYNDIEIHTLQVIINNFKKTFVQKSNLAKVFNESLEQSKKEILLKVNEAHAIGDIYETNAPTANDTNRKKTIKIKTSNGIVVVDKEDIFKQLRPIDFVRYYSTDKIIDTIIKSRLLVIDDN